MNTTINNIIHKLIPYFYVGLFAYLITSIVSTLLPKEDINFISLNSNTLEYKKYNGFYSNVQNSAVKNQEIKKEVAVQTLDRYKLRGIYSTQSNAGWINVEDERANKSYILSQWEELDGYLLTKLFKNYVIFEKQGQEYKLEISKNDDEKISYEISSTKNDIKEQIIVKNDVVEVKRDYLNSYVNDIDKVWNNISIKEIKDGNKIDGFKIFNVVKGSVFEKLGLKKGDIIKAINNTALSSYADAFKVYNNMSNTKYLNIEILRNNEVMELNYEIN